MAEFCGICMEHSKTIETNGIPFLTLKVALVSATLFFHPIHNNFVTTVNNNSASRATSRIEAENFRFVPNVVGLNKWRLSRARLPEDSMRCNLSPGLMPFEKPIRMFEQSARVLNAKSIKYYARGNTLHIVAVKEPSGLELEEEYSRLHIELMSSFPNIGIDLMIYDEDEFRNDLVPSDAESC